MTSSHGRTNIFSPEVARMVGEVAALTPEITTVATQRPNRIVDVSASGILVHTERSQSKGAPQRVDAWMVEAAWAHLRNEGSITQSFVLASDGLNIKRSAFVIALLARFPGVRVECRKPTGLSFQVQPAPGSPLDTGITNR